MARNADVRKLLQTKLGIKRAQLYKVAKDCSDKLSISTGDAMLLLAAKNGINLKKHGGNLSPEKLSYIRSLLPHITAIDASAAPTAAGSNHKHGKPKSKKAFKVAVQDAEKDPILRRTTHAEMETMVPVYKTLYILENSIRQFITRVLIAKHGRDWWTKCASQKLKDDVAGRRKSESVNAWHQKRSSNPIDYLDLDLLPRLVRTTEADFIPTFFKSVGWFQQFVDEVYQSRCVVCHMNPLTQNNIDGVGVRFNQWETLVKEKIGEVKALETSPASGIKTAVSPALPPSAAGISGPASSTAPVVSTDPSSKPPTA